MAALRLCECWPMSRLCAYNTRMTQDAAELLKRALALTEEERAELAGSLLESLDGGHEDPESVEAAWSEEIARRIEDLDSGKAKTVPWEEVRHRISSKLNHSR
jgi:putative addiction module component (TIGR02574 family)